MLTVLMLIGRGASIVWGGVSLLQMSWWLPFPLVFMLVMAAAIEFIEAVFCIYMLFNRWHAHNPLKPGICTWNARTGAG